MTLFSEKTDNFAQSFDSLHIYPSNLNAERPGVFPVYLRVYPNSLQLC